MYENANLPDHVKAAHDLAEKVFNQYLPEQQVEFVNELRKQLRFHQSQFIEQLQKELEAKTKIWSVN